MSPRRRVPSKTKKNKSPPKKRKSPPKTKKRKSPTKTKKRKSPTKTKKRRSPTKKQKKKSPTRRRRTTLEGSVVRITSDTRKSTLSGVQKELQERAFKAKGLPRCQGRFPIRCYNEPEVRIPGVCVSKVHDCYSYKITREASFPSPTIPDRLGILRQSRQRAMFL